MISTTSKKSIESQYNAITKLQEKCESCNAFRGQTAKKIWLYSICGEYSTEEGQAMLAIAEYEKNTYAIYAPEYLTEKQFVVIEFLLREVEPEDKIVVFSQETYNALGKYSYGKPMNVQLCV